MIYPKHIAIIPDWNRTWAKEKWLPQMLGHMEWFKRIVELSEYIFNQTWIEIFTIWWLSTENTKNRKPEELNYLYDLYKTIPDNLFKMLSDNQVNFKWIWSEENLPSHLIEYFRDQEKKFKYDTNKYLILAVNYWWRDEIIRGINNFKNDKSRDDKTKNISEEEFTKYLDFWNLPNIELVIRTKWDLAKRLSWFMLRWIWYAQLFFTDIKFPDFNID